VGPPIQKPMSFDIGFCIGGPTADDLRHLREESNETSVYEIILQKLCSVFL